MIYWNRLPPGNQWDQNMLELLLANRLYPTDLYLERQEWPDSDGLILCIPGRYYFNQPPPDLSRYKWVLAVRTGDEEDLLGTDWIEHPNCKWWVQTPKMGKDYGNARFIPLGYPPHFNEPAGPGVVKDLDVFLAGQNTHVRRDECFKALGMRFPCKVWTSPDRLLSATEGFTNGVSPETYAGLMHRTRVAPCPSGPACPETFRVYEALEAGAIPITDDITPAYDSTGYWLRLFPDAPFPIIRDYSELPAMIETELASYSSRANEISAWWLHQKRKLASWLMTDLKELGAI